MALVAPLRFALDLPVFKKEVPFELFGYPTPTSDRITNVEFTTIDEIKINDVRDLQPEPTIDTMGFQYIKHQSRCPLEPKYFERAGTEIEGNPVVLDYLDETIGVVKSQFQADKVICFDWRFRRTGAPTNIIPEPDDIYDIRLQAVTPGHDIHCDFSAKGGEERLEMHLLDEEMDLIRQGKMKAKIVNVWRSMSVVMSTPLVLTDRRTIQKDDLMEVEKILPDKVERAYYLKHRPYHQYYYMSHMEPDDVAIFVTWDALTDGATAEYSPHGAASQFEKDWEQRPRESLEVRCILLT
jgi:hypothetical protein